MNQFTNRRHRLARTVDVDHQPTPGELLSASFNEMLEGFIRHYGLTGDPDVKAIIDRANAALAANR